VTRRRTALVLAAVATLAISGCGGSSTVPASKYVNVVCWSLGRWQHDFRTAQLRLAHSAPQARSLAAGKQLYVTFTGRLYGATNRITRRIQRAGTPSVSGGDQFAKAVAGDFSRASSDFAQIEKQATALPTTSARDYEAAAAGMTASIRQTLTRMSSVTLRSNGQLRAAASKDSGCRSLTAGR
jgi:hypothetical protein